MEERPVPSPDSPGSEISDAASFFLDGADKRIESARREEVIRPAVDSYDIQDLPQVEDAIKSPVQQPALVREKKSGVPSTGMHLESGEAVEQVWTRWGEWGGTIVVMGIAAVSLFGILWLLLSWESYSLLFLCFLLGGLLLIFLSYPILITLERPVRVTPEQAVLDFYGALSHHYPHFRRMWLLLSDRGKVSGSFASFDGFRDYWNQKLKELRSGKASGITPLRFGVEDFKSPKSAGLSSIDATYVLTVLVRGDQEAGPIHRIKVKATLVKGPDKMWYLDQGRLP